MTVPRPRAAVDGGSRGVLLVAAVLAVSLLIAGVPLLAAPTGSGAAGLLPPAVAAPGNPPQPTATPSGGPGPSVGGDEEQQAYLISGELLLPGTVPADVREMAAGCVGCTWRITWACPQGEDGGCVGVIAACPVGQEWLRLWVVRPTGVPTSTTGTPTDGFVRVTVACFTADGPVTVAEMTRRVRDRLRAAVPPLEPAAQPPTGAVARLPMIFRSGQPDGPLHRDLDLLGFDVQLTAAPVWWWRFGDGAQLLTDRAGGRWPQRTVEHVYRTAGRWQVAVRATWRATFTADGLGPFPVPDPLEQSAVLPVRVGEGRAVLVR